MFYINTFFIFSFFGYCYEVITNFIMHHTYRVTLLFGPWMPIYGYGLLIAILINHLLEKRNLKGFQKLVIFFFINIFILTILEALGGYLIEWIFHTSYWNYENLPLHIGKYICIPISVFWGFGAILLHYCIYPFLIKYIKKIPKWISYTCIVLFIIDNILSILHHFSFF